MPSMPDMDSHVDHVTPQTMHITPNIMEYTPYTHDTSTHVPIAYNHTQPIIPSMPPTVVIQSIDIPSIDIPTFEGDQQDFEKWLDLFHSVAINSGWPREFYASKLLTRLRGDALDYLYDYNIPRTDYEAMVQGLTKHFDMAKKAPLQRMEFDVMTQGYNESAQEFANRVVKQAK
jgi:hypothetical protein